MTPHQAGDSAPLTVADYVDVLLRRSWIVIAVTVVVVAIGVYRSHRETPIYQATGQVEIVTSGTDSALLPTQLGIITSPSVHAAAARLKPGIGEVNAQQSGQSNIISISATSPTPKTATRTVNGTIDAYVAYVKSQAARQTAGVAAPIQARINRLETEINAANTPPPPAGSARAARRDALISEQSALQQRLDSLQIDTAGAATDVSVVSRPAVPTSPIRPNHRTDALIAFGAGLLLGLLIAFFVEYLARSKRDDGHGDSRPRATSDVAVIGVLPPTGTAGDRVISLTEPESSAAQSYRALQGAATLIGLDRGRCVAVTSAPGRDGKTDTLANLAVSLARSSRRVIVVDCDLREPRVHELFNVPNRTGFTSVMRGSRVAEVLQPVPGVAHLFALTSGPLPHDPAAMLASPTCREVIGALLQGGTIVLVDTPPALPFTDACVLAENARVDAVMLVATPGPESQEQVDRALEALKQTGVTQIGVVQTTTEPPSSPSSPSAADALGRWPHRWGTNGGAQSSAGAFDGTQTPIGGPVLGSAGTS